MASLRLSAGLLVGLVAFAGLPGEAAHDEPDELDCGNFAPFVTMCSDPYWIPFVSRPRLSMAVFGVVGDVHLTLLEHVNNVLVGSATWTCHFDAIHGAQRFPDVHRCDSTPTYVGTFVWPGAAGPFDLSVGLACRVEAAEVAENQRGGPAGSWGCHAKF